MSLGENIAKKRKELGWTQKEFADQVGVHKAHVTRIENDRLRPNPTTLERIAKAFEVSVDELFGVQSQEQTTGIRDSKLLVAFQAAQELNEEDKAMVLKIVQAFLTKQKMEQALHWRVDQAQAS